MKPSIDWNNLDEPLDRGRLDPTIREISARTQVKTENLLECPRCSADSVDHVEFYEVDMVAVSFHCHKCDALGELYSVDGGDILELEDSS